jgi:GTPase involved in cell partitioning and DNA repair
MLRKIEQIIVFYKSDIKKKDMIWINLHVSKLNVLLMSYQKDLTKTKLLALIYMVSEHYKRLLRNPTRKTVWENLETYSSKVIKKNQLLVDDEIEFVEKIYEEMVNDLLYCKII